MLNNVWGFLITLQQRKSLIFIVNIKLTRREKRNKQKIWNYFSSIHSWSYTLKDHLQWIVAYLNCFFFFWRTRVHEKRSQCANIEKCVGEKSKMKHMELFKYYNNLPTLPNVTHCTQRQRLLPYYLQVLVLNLFHIYNIDMDWWYDKFFSLKQELTFHCFEFHRISK